MAKQHSLGQDEAARRVKELEPELSGVFGVKLAWKDHQADVSGSGLSGTISVEDKQVAIDLKLGLKLALAQGKIQKAIDMRVGKALA